MTTDETKTTEDRQQGASDCSQCYGTGRTFTVRPVSNGRGHLAEWSECDHVPTPGPDWAIRAQSAALRGALS